VSNARTAVDLAHGEVVSLADIVDRESLTEVCRSFYDLFNLSIRVFSREGALLATIHDERSICRYVNGLPRGRIACSNTVGQAQRIVPTDGVVTHACFTGAVYHVVPILYDGRQLGRFVIGPFLPADADDVPETLMQIDPAVNRERSLKLLDEMPRVREETATRIAAHLRGILDLILFSGHRAHLTSEMHLASVRENYRELAEKNAKLQQAYDRLQELDRLKSNFLATVSHELRTPLTSIIGYSEMMAEGIAGDLNSEQRGFVETIRSKGELLLQLITSLLDLNKLEREQLTLFPQRLDPTALLVEIKDMLRPDAEKKGIKITVNFVGDVPWITADPIRLRQILINVTSNAVKFTPRNGTVALGCKETSLSTDDGDDDDAIGMAVLFAPERAVEFSVTDTGIGMPEEELKRIFDAFYQVDGSSTREHGGTGLGLAIAKRLVDAHGGSIRVESQVNRGTTFLVTLPVDATGPRAS